MTGLCFPSPLPDSPPIVILLLPENVSVVALIPVHDDPLRQASIDLVILPQGFALHRADEIVQLLLRVAVDVCDAHKFGTILIDAINNGSNRFHIVERVVVGIIPMIMEPDIGILTDQGSPPSLQVIWTATLVATLNFLSSAL